MRYWRDRHSYPVPGTTRASAISSSTMGLKCSIALLIGGVVGLPANAQSTSNNRMASATGEILSRTSADREVLEVQILLDRARHSPGVIDGVMGGNTRRAIRAYQRSAGLQPTGQISSELLRNLRQRDSEGLFRTYVITQEDLDRPFVDVPSGMAAMANLDKVAFERPSEYLAERFHMAESFLEKLNPDADFGKAGTEITVVRPGGDENLPSVARIEVDKQSGELRAISAEGQAIASYPMTIGSNVHPSPSETLEVRAIAPDPTYHFDPSGRDWGPDKSLTIAAGPNNPVGVVWIDLSRDGYGIHGTPDPALIGKTSSHGCVRLTNWDAHELSKAIGQGTPVKFL